MDGGVMMMNHGEAAVSSIELVDGTLFDPLQPDPDLMSLEVIAHALANNGRFAGQVRNFYSIAQHSVLVAALTHQDMASQRCALLHDADECFGLPDMPTPVKPMFPEYVAAQKRIGEAVDRRYGVSAADHARVKPADREALLLEKSCLKDPANAGYWQRWSNGVAMPNWLTIEPLDPKASLSLITAAMVRVFSSGLPISPEWLLSEQGFSAPQPS